MADGVYELVPEDELTGDDATVRWPGTIDDVVFVVETTELPFVEDTARS